MKNLETLGTSIKKQKKVLKKDKTNHNHLTSHTKLFQNCILPFKSVSVTYTTVTLYKHYHHILCKSSDVQQSIHVFILTESNQSTFTFYFIPTCLWSFESKEFENRVVPKWRHCEPHLYRQQVFSFIKTVLTLGCSQMVTGNL